MVTTTPGVNAQLEQIERELLDAVYEAAKVSNPEIMRLIKSKTGDPEQDAGIVEKIRELTGGTNASLADWFIKTLETTSRRDKAVTQYVLARDLLTGMQVL